MICIIVAVWAVVPRCIVMVSCSATDPCPIKTGSGKEKIFRNIEVSIKRLYHSHNFPHVFPPKHLNNMANSDLPLSPRISCLNTHSFSPEKHFLVSYHPPVL